MAIIRGYMGVSLDHYIASPDGTLDWLTKYDNIDFGAYAYANFIKDIRTVVMGRATYEAIAPFDSWPYREQSTIVVTSRPIERPPVPVETWAGDIPGLVSLLRALDDGDVWVVGGGLLQQAMIALGGLDRLELFIVPEIVGDGIPLFPPNGFSRRVTLVEANTFAGGVVRLCYDFAAAGEAT